MINSRLLWSRDPPPAKSLFILLKIFTWKCLPCSFSEKNMIVSVDTPWSIFAPCNPFETSWNKLPASSFWFFPSYTLTAIYTMTLGDSNNTLKRPRINLSQGSINAHPSFTSSAVYRTCNKSYEHTPHFLYDTMSNLRLNFFPSVITCYV